MFATRYSNGLCKLGARGFSTSFRSQAKHSYQFVVVGGGSGGLSIASTLCRRYPKATAIIEPSENHYYQPLWTLVGGGIQRLEDSVRPTGSLIPSGGTWYKTSVVQFNPEKNLVKTADGNEIKYDFLIVAVGLQLRFDMVAGLKEALGTPGVGCNYSALTVNDTWKAIQNFEGGNAIFTLPNTPIKCFRCPTKNHVLGRRLLQTVVVQWVLAKSSWNNVRDKANIMFNTSLDKIFGVKKYADALTRIVNKRDIQINYKRNLFAIKPDKKEAVFEVLDDSKSEQKLETYQVRL
ncbi:hypothetical protein OS493_034544 [Desmophyllum pertusum]|uniref:Sulfide:quinone oxidoreductase, mitochondrial n=1 Tax=Desmophyllum pertusum TaxID=174260 RepID=A0A9W9Y7S5_9CNID|nr:hypothetical protein OS493_034544 [Desmophyllum pertusum]